MRKLRKGKVKGTLAQGMRRRLLEARAAAVKAAEAGGVVAAEGPEAEPEPAAESAPREGPAAPELAPEAAAAAPWPEAGAKFGVGVEHLQHMLRLGEKGVSHSLNCAVCVRACAGLLRIGSVIQVGGRCVCVCVSFSECWVD